MATIDPLAETRLKTTRFSLLPILALAAMLFFARPTHAQGPVGTGISPLTSLVLNKGTDVGITTDFDGDARPSNGGYELDYDETTFIAPTAVDDLNEGTNTNVAVTISPLANDIQSAGDNLSLSAIGSLAHGTAIISGITQIVYTPTLNYTGPDVFTYTAQAVSLLNDTTTITVSVTVDSVNDVPVALDDSLMTHRYDNDNLFVPASPVLTNDSDPSDGITASSGLTISAVGAGSQGGTAAIATNYGSVEELNESNNLFGPETSTVDAGAAIVNLQNVTPSPEGLPTG